MNHTNTGSATPQPKHTPPPNGARPAAPSRPVFVSYATGGLSVLATSNNDPAARFHAFQAAIYLLAALAAHGLLSIVGLLAPFRPVFDWAALGVYGYLLWLAWEDKPKSLPIIGAIARRQSHPGSSADGSTIH